MPIVILQDARRGRRPPDLGRALRGQRHRAAARGDRLAASDDARSARQRHRDAARAGRPRRHHRPARQHVLRADPPRARRRARSRSTPVRATPWRSRCASTSRSSSRTRCSSSRPLRRGRASRRGRAPAPLARERRPRGARQATRCEPQPSRCRLPPTLPSTDRRQVSATAVDTLPRSSGTLLRSRLPPSTSWGVIAATAQS